MSTKQMCEVLTASGRPLPDQTLRLWASDTMYGPWLEATREGHCQGRLFSEGDVTLLQWVDLQHNARELRHAELQARLHILGRPACLAGDLSPGEMLERTLATISDLRLRCGQLEGEKATLVQDREEVLTLVSKARAAVGSVKSAGVELYTEAEARLVTLQGSLESWSSQLEVADSAVAKAWDTFETTVGHLLGAGRWRAFWRWPALRGEINTAMLNLSLAIVSRQRLHADWARFLGLAKGFLLRPLDDALQSLQETEENLQIPNGARQTIPSGEEDPEGKARNFV